MNYVLIDEIQYCGKALPEGFDLSKIHPDDRERMFVDFYRVLNGLRTTPNVDIYVTGSNSRLLASDVATEFRGRGHVIHVTPLSFAEFMPLRASEQNPFKVIEEYLLYGGFLTVFLPPHLMRRKHILKTFTLQSISETL